MKAAVTFFTLLWCSFSAQSGSDKIKPPEAAELLTLTLEAALGHGESLLFFSLGPSRYLIWQKQMVFNVVMNICWFITR